MLKRASSRRAVTKGWPSNICLGPKPCAPFRNGVPNSPSVAESRHLPPFSADVAVLSGLTPASPGCHRRPGGSHWTLQSTPRAPELLWCGLQTLLARLVVVRPTPISGRRRILLHPLDPLRSPLRRSDRRTEVIGLAHDQSSAARHKTKARAPTGRTTPRFGQRSKGRTPPP